MGGEISSPGGRQAWAWVNVQEDQSAWGGQAHRDAWACVPEERIPGPAT